MHQTGYSGVRLQAQPPPVHIGRRGRHVARAHVAQRVAVGAGPVQPLLRVLASLHAVGHERLCTLPQAQKQAWQIGIHCRLTAVAARCSLRPGLPPFGFLILLSEHSVAVNGRGFQAVCLSLECNDARVARWEDT